ncbi:MAG: redoxin domain-containing protein [Anaerolineaceae bacterium]|jgi:peroxiredoxin (alkyl hydroperoxide reductase subunit C)|nr:redoxin domain-containing protein [Anaerolineaceae bacterium]
MAEKKESCVKPTQGPIAAAMEPAGELIVEKVKEAPRMVATAGKPAPDFELTAFVDGGFKNIKLSDYKGKWIVICFYPGDFTFV